MKIQFEINKVYSHGFFSGDTLKHFKVTKRTAKSIWVVGTDYKGNERDQTPRRVKIADYANDYEMAYPSKGCMAIHANEPMQTPHFSHIANDGMAVYKNVATN